MFHFQHTRHAYGPRSPLTPRIPLSSTESTRSRHTALAVRSLCRSPFFVKWERIIEWTALRSAGVKFHEAVYGRNATNSRKPMRSLSAETSLAERASSFRIAFPRSLIKKLFALWFSSPRGGYNHYLMWVTECEVLRRDMLQDSPTC